MRFRVRILSIFESGSELYPLSPARVRILSSMSESGPTSGFYKHPNLFGTNLWLPFSIQHDDLLNWDPSVFSSVKRMGYLS